MNITDWLFGCSHERTTWPQTRRRRTHITCLKCGKEFTYSWQLMKIVEPVKQKTIAPVLEMEK